MDATSLDQYVDLIYFFVKNLIVHVALLNCDKYNTTI